MKSPAWDEPAHIAAGLSYIKTGEIRVNPQHPPLLKELSGLSLALSGARWPNSKLVRDLLAGEPQLQWVVGTNILMAGGVDRTLFWARFPLILVATLLGTLIYFWGRQLVGGTAALGALFLFALDPTMVAHSYLVTTDVGFAAFAILFYFSLWNYLQHPSRRGLVLCGLAMGAALCAKFSAVLLLPVAGALLLGAATLRPYRDTAVDLDDPCPCGSGRKFKNCHGILDKHGKPAFDHQPYAKAIRAGGAFLLMGGVALLVIQMVYLLGNGPALYLDGLRTIYADHDPNYLAYLAGQMQPRFLSYFAVAYLVKEPIAGVVLVAVGLLILLQRKSFPLLTRLFLLLPPVVLFLAHSLSAADIGIRYIIPVLPFAYLIGGIGLASLITSASRWKRSLAVVLAAWCILAAVGIHPDQLSYFNEAACLADSPGRIGLDGGSRCGPAWLDDSNVDWGEGLKQLKTWIDQHAKGRTIRLAYFGSFPPDPYDIPHESIRDEDLAAHDPAPGLYAVSAHLVAHMTGLVDHFGRGSRWLRTTPPIDVVGHAFYIYEIPPVAAAAVQGAAAARTGFTDR